MSKTGKIKYNKRINKVIGYTILFISFISFSIYPESHSKYVTKKEEALVYNTNLYKLNQGTITEGNIKLEEKITLGGENHVSDHKTAYLTLNFDRSSVVKNKTDKYYIDINVEPKNACEIVEITTQAKKQNLTKGTITYTKAQNTLAEGEEPVNPANTVVIKCNVEDIIDDTGKLEVPITITERVGIKNPEVFTYLTGSFIDEDYYKLNPIPPSTDKPIISEDNSLTILDQENNNLDYYYDEFWKWVEDYIAKVEITNYPADIESTIRDYILKVYSETEKENVLKETILNEKNPWPTLPGLKVIVHETNEGVKFYQYVIDENLVGYALTDVPAGSSEVLEFDNSKDLRMYFSGTTTKELNEAFDLYLYYLYKENCEDICNMDMINKVKDFVGDNAISKVLNGSSIIGLNKINDITINLRANMPEHIYNKEYNSDKLDEDKKVRISFNSIQNMQDVFINDIKFVYQDLISENALNVIKNHNELYKKVPTASVIKNSTSRNSYKGAFNDYFVIYDDYENSETGEKHNYYLLINIYSDGTNYNYATITKLDCDSSHNIEFVNNNQNDKLNISDITITHNDDDDLKMVKDKLDSYFGDKYSLTNPVTEEINETLEDGSIITSYKTTYTFIEVNNGN